MTAQEAKVAHALCAKLLPGHEVFPRFRPDQQGKQVKLAIVVQEIVISEIRSLRNVFAARIESERAAGLEKEARADEHAVDLSNSLVELIQLHGLPPEVIAYDPRS